MTRILFGALVCVVLWTAAGIVNAVPITRTYTYQGQEVSPGNTITGQFTVTANSFSNLLFDLTQPSYCTALNCSFEMTNGSPLNTWNQSNIGASFFNVAFDAAGNIATWFIHVGSGPFGLFADYQPPTFIGDRVVDNGTQYPAGGGTNGTPGVWTLASTTETFGIPEPAMVWLFAAGLLALALCRQRLLHWRYAERQRDRYGVMRLHRDRVLEIGTL
jgi:hypothetical protein